MPVYITQNPVVYTPSDNPITFVFMYDNNVGEYNHVFKISVTLDGVLIGVFDYFPVLNDINYYSGYIDISNIIKSYVDKATTDQTGIVADASNYATFSINVNCWYSTNPNDAASDQSAQLSSSNYFVFKGCLSNKEFNSWNYADYTTGSAGRKFLTDNTNIVELRETDETYLQIITDGSSDEVEIRLYTSAGVLIDTNSVSLLTCKISQIKLSTTLLETIFAPSSVASASYFNVRIKSTGGVLNYSQTKRININREGCFNGKNLVWLNKFGAYDTFLFTYNNILKSDIQSKSYGKRLGSFDGTTYDLDTKDTGSLTYLKTITDKIQIVSDWLSQVEQNFVVQVYESPLVYINEGTLYENIEIENSSYQFKQAEHEELFNEIIDAKFTHSRKSITI